MSRRYSLPDCQSAYQIRYGRSILYGRTTFGHITWFRFLHGVHSGRIIIYVNKHGTVAAVPA